MPIEESTLPKAIEHQVRLLLPFFINRMVLVEAAKHLADLRHETSKSGKSWLCWKQDKAVPSLYQDEVLPCVDGFLFGSGAGDCAYWRVPDDTAAFWFKKGGLFSKFTDGKFSENGDRPVLFEARLAYPGIELFLSPHGAGVFSVCFTPKSLESLKFIQEFNYRLSQTRPNTQYNFRLPHSAEYQTPPTDDAPLSQRLGQNGGAFNLIEWVDFLLEPLQAFGCSRMQEQFSIYSVTRLDVSADFTCQQAKDSLRPFLNSLAHVEEFHHVGSLEVGNRILNPRHWAAVGSLGACHCVSDQDPPRPFDEQRLPVALRKYFIPYLIGLLQRIALQGILQKARTPITTFSANSRDVEKSKMASHCIEQLHELYLHTLAFTVNGYFTEVSSREAVNQYYQLVQSGLRVKEGFQTVQRALHDAEVMDNDRYQGRALSELKEMAGRLNQMVENQQHTIDGLKRLLDEAGKNVRIVAHVQEKVEWLEVFFVSYYATALVYYLDHSELIGKRYAGISLVIAPFLSGGIAFLGLKPHQLKQHSDHESPQSGDHGIETQNSGNKSRIILLALVFLFAIWLGVGFWLKQCESAEQTQTDIPATPVLHGYPQTLNQVSASQTTRPFPRPNSEAIGWGP